MTEKERFEKKLAVVNNCIADLICILDDNGTSITPFVSPVFNKLTTIELLLKDINELMN